MASSREDYMDVLITVFMVIGALALIGVLINLAFWLAVVVGIVALVAMAISGIFGVSFWASFVTVVVVAAIGWLLWVIFGSV